LCKLNRKLTLGYVIISRFEECLRLFISERLEGFFDNFIKGIPENIIEKAKTRSNGQLGSPLELLEYTDFPHLKEIIIRTFVLPKRG